MTSADKANIIATIFNKTDLASVNALLANTGDTWDSLQNSITNSAGAAQQMADTQLDNLQGQITILKSALEGLAISFGELLMPAIKQIVGWVQKFVDWLNSMDEVTKKVVVTVALLAAAIGPVLIVIGKVISAVGTIMTVVPKIASAISAVKTAFAALNVTMLANPIVLIIAAITALVAAFIYLWNTNEGFRQFGSICGRALSRRSLRLGTQLHPSCLQLGKAFFLWHRRSGVQFPAFSPRCGKASRACSPLLGKLSAEL